MSTLKTLIEKLKEMPRDNRSVTLGENDGNPENLTICFSDWDMGQLEHAYSLQQMLDNSVFRDRLNTAITEFTEYVKAINKTMEER
jgi:hypothetical protein